MDKNAISDVRQDKKTPFLLAILILLVLFLRGIFTKHKTPKTTYKHQLYRRFGVNKKTFAKWVYHFCDSKILSYQVYIKCKKLTDEQVQHIYAVMGNSEVPPMTKADIIEYTEGSYRSLRDSVRRYPERFGISVVAFEDMNVFPSAIAKRIIQQYNG